MPNTTISELRQQRDDLNTKVLNRLKQDKVLLKTLADTMAESAMHIQSQGYNNFLNSREMFLSEVERIAEDYSAYVCTKK